MCPQRQDELLQRITRLEQEGEQLRAEIEGWQEVASRTNSPTSLPVPSLFTARAAVPIVGSPLSPSSRRSSTSALSPQQFRIAPEVEVKSETKERGVIVSPTFEDAVVGSDIINNMC